ncbi:helix-turn-helix domain-containing protein [bacterium]|nr:MAG: helix-turn-helix domain-containing protein [bacterium]
MNNQFKIAVYQYPDCSLTAVYGLNEMFELANTNCQNLKVKKNFLVTILRSEDISEVDNQDKFLFDLIIIPPSVNGKYYLKPEDKIKSWLTKQHSFGTVITSACAGTFILASTQLINGRKATTHWLLADQFSKKYPKVNLQIDEVLIDDGDIITAGGLMAWLDLGLAIVSRFISLQVMHQLGRQMVIDTGKREQKFYQIFYPNLEHKDKEVIKIQHFLQSHFSDKITIDQLADQAILGQRTFLRRFMKATGFKPTEYIQKLRVQKACELIESTNENFENIAIQVGYEDASAFRKIFRRITGLTPGEFRRRFVG